MGRQLKLWVPVIDVPIFTAQQIRDMSMEDYAKYRTFLMAEARLAVETKKVSMRDILKMSNS